MRLLTFMAQSLAREERDRSHIMYRRCAWHGEVFGVVQVERADLAGFFTDTICAHCLARVRENPARMAA